MSALDLTRQSGIIPTNAIQGCEVTIVGAGAIGSHVAECLAKIGISKLVVYDYDSVEKHNLPNQGYRLSDLGKKKVAALKERLEADTGVSVEAKDEKVDRSTKFSTSIVISALDNMASRKQVWLSVKDSLDTQLYVDARMGAMYGLIYAVNLQSDTSMQAYDTPTVLFDDKDAHMAPCTEKATIFCAQGLAAFMTSIIADHICGVKLPQCVEVDFARKEMARKG